VSSRIEVWGGDEAVKYQPGSRLAILKMPRGETRPGTDRVPGPHAQSAKEVEAQRKPKELWGNLLKHSRAFPLRRRPPHTHHSPRRPNFQTPSDGSCLLLGLSAFPTLPSTLSHVGPTMPLLLRAPI
jgi:hypothetical protein